MITLKEIQQLTKAARLRQELAAKKEAEDLAARKAKELDEQKAQIEHSVKFQTSRYEELIRKAANGGGESFQELISEDEMSDMWKEVYRRVCQNLHEFDAKIVSIPEAQYDGLFNYTYYIQFKW